MKGDSRKEFAFAIGSPAFIWQALFFYLPLCILLISSVVQISEAGHFTGLTFSNFKQLMHKNYFHIIWDSVILALSTAIICLFVAFPLAHFIAFRIKRYKNILLFFLIVPFWTNFLLHLYAWFFVLENHGFLNLFLQYFHIIATPLPLMNTLFAVVLMMVYVYLPFMILPIYSSLERFDIRLIEASYDLGATPFQTFRQVMLPLTMPAVRAGFFLVFIPAYGEFIIPELMGGDKKYFIGNVISQFILGNETQGIGAAFTVISIAALILAALFLYGLLTHLTRTLKRGIK